MRVITPLSFYRCFAWLMILMMSLYTMHKNARKTAGRQKVFQLAPFLFTLVHQPRLSFCRSILP